MLAISRFWTFSAATPIKSPLKLAIMRFWDRTRLLSGLNEQNIVWLVISLMKISTISYRIVSIVSCYLRDRHLHSVRWQDLRERGQPMWAYLTSIDFAVDKNLAILHYSEACFDTAIFRSSQFIELFSHSIVCIRGIFNSIKNLLLLVACWWLEDQVLFARSYLILCHWRRAHLNQFLVRDVYLR